MPMVRIHQTQPPSTISYQQANLINGFRILMSKLAYLTRFYIVGSITGLGTKEATEQEFLTLPVEGNQLVKDLTGVTIDFTPVTQTYIEGMKKLIDGMVSGDQAMADESIRQLYETSDRNAKYLAQLSPYWDENTWKGIFYRYNQDLVAEVIAIENGDYNKALDIFSRMMQEAYTRGDYYAEGFFPYLPKDQQNIPIAYFNMVKDFRQIRTEWAYLTRFYIVAKVLGLGTEEYVTQRFYDLISRTAEKFELILGTEIGEQLESQLSIYIIRLEELIDAILVGNQSDIENKSNVVRQYASDLSAYLSSVNPYWDETKWKELFLNSARYLIQESNEIQQGKYVEATEIFQQLLYTSLSIGDYYALGLYQFTVNGESNQAGTVPAQ